MTTREKRLEEALNEVMSWIDNWTPDFVYDAEWPDTEQKVRNAFKPEEIPWDLQTK